MARCVPRELDHFFGKLKVQASSRGWLATRGKAATAGGSVPIGLLPAFAGRYELYVRSRMCTHEYASSDELFR